jgi:ribosome-binding protein aMBF1 (putative translation factor)
MSKSKPSKCPVCDWEIKDGGIKVKVGNRELVVCCDDCAKKAKANPPKDPGTRR